MFNKGDIIKVTIKATGMVRYAEAEVEGVYFDERYGANVIEAIDLATGDGKNLTDDKYAFELVRPAQVVEELPASRPTMTLVEARNWAARQEVDFNEAAWIAANTCTQPSNSDRIIAEIKAARAKIEAETIEFKAMVEQRFAEFREKSKNADWQQVAYGELQKHSLTAIYKAINCFAAGGSYVDGSMVAAGLMDTHIVGGVRADVLTEKGYMLVWARGVSYFPDSVMAGL